MFAFADGGVADLLRQGGVAVPFDLVGRRAFFLIPIGEDRGGRRAVGGLDDDDLIERNGCAAGLLGRQAVVVLLRAVRAVTAVGHFVDTLHGVHALIAQGAQRGAGLRELRHEAVHLADGRVDVARLRVDVGLSGAMGGQLASPPMPVAACNSWSRSSAGLVRILRCAMFYILTVGNICGFRTVSPPSCCAGDDRQQALQFSCPYSPVKQENLRLRPVRGGRCNAF